MSNPSEARCPRCADPLLPSAPEGLCPRCLGAMNLAPETQFTDVGGGAARAPLTPAELAPHFPQLEIIECLGRGGMGVVYKARQKTLNRIVALKLLAPERVTDAGFAERFTREAQALARLNHPNIVTIHDFGVTTPPQTPDAKSQTPFYFLLMEFVDGVNLRQAMRAGRFTPEQALLIVPPVCEALHYAHEQGIVHRDIKPENLLLDKAGRVKIADFGIAKMLGSATDGTNTSYATAESYPPLTQATTAGTPGYMAPEQREHQRTDHRADIYSLGVVLYEMLTGELPGKELQPPSKRVQVDVRIDEIVLRALEVKPELRFQTAAEFRTQVETIAATTPSQKGAAPTEPAGTPTAGTTWQSPTSGWGHFIGYLFGITFTSPLAFKLANASALGFLCFIGFAPFPGAKRMFGFSGFFGLIGIAFMVEMAKRWHAGGVTGAPGQNAAPQSASSGSNAWLAPAISLVLFFAGLVAGIPFVNALPVHKDSGYLALTAFMVCAASVVGLLTTNFVRQLRSSPEAGANASARAWLKGLGWLAFILAVPVMGFGLFFLLQVLVQPVTTAGGGGWNPTPAEALFVPLTWFGSVLLPLAGLTLLKLAAVMPAPATVQAQSSGRKVVVMLLTAGLAFGLALLVGFVVTALVYRAQEATVAERDARAAEQRARDATGLFSRAGATITRSNPRLDGDVFSFDYLVKPLPGWDVWLVTEEWQEAAVRGEPTQPLGKRAEQLGASGTARVDLSHVKLDTNGRNRAQASIGPAGGGGSAVYPGHGVALMNFTTCGGHRVMVSLELRRQTATTGSAQHIEFKVLRVEHPPGSRTLRLHFERDASPGLGFEVGMDAKPAPGGQLPEFADAFWLRTGWVGAGDARVLNWTLPEPFTPDEARAAAAQIEQELLAQRDAWSRLSDGAVPKVGSVRHRDGWSCELFFRVKRGTDVNERQKEAATSPITSSIAASDNSPAAIAAAQQRGIASATRDIQAGNFRILRYGVLMRTSPDDKDEETGFRIQWVAGSILSSQFQAEADAYNFAMREHYQKHVRWQRKAAADAKEPQGPYPVAARATNIATAEGKYLLANGATLVITAKPARGTGPKHHDGRLDWPKSATNPKAESFDMVLSEGAPFAVGWRADGQVLWVACGAGDGTNNASRYVRKLTINGPGDVDEQSWDAREKGDFGGLPPELRRVFDAFIAPATNAPPVPSRKF
jgi:serine/threonine protein kinase